MLTELILFIVFTRTSYSQSSSLNSSQSEVEFVEGRYDQKCLPSIHKLPSSEAFKCINLPTDTPIANHICANSGKDFTSCTKRVIDSISDCISEKEFPSFVVNSLSRALSKFCNADDIGRLSNISDAKCRSRWFLGVKDYVISQCFTKMNVTQYAGKFSLGKEVVCGDLKAMRQCVINFLVKDCDVPTKDVELVTSIFDELDEECSSTNSTGTISMLNATAILFSVLFIVRISF